MSVGSASPVRVETAERGTVLRVRLAAGKGNVLDSAAAAALSDAFEQAARAPALKMILLEAEGPHFSFGASVVEHLPDRAPGMLRGLHALLAAIVECPVLVAAAVRGQCLGGGLEVVSLAQRIFAAPDARLGQPEIVLGVFAPAASVGLASRVGRARAEDLCLTGRIVPADEAHAIGLVDEIAADPEEAALAWARTHLLPRSASSLRFAVRAARIPYARRYLADLDEAERLYVGGLRRTHDGVEGLNAFLEKRAPVWRDA
jgi:cyclohexa-1,5-dienecarbonyl-CoA hydratase